MLYMLYMQCACEQAAAVAQDAAKASNSDCTKATAALDTATAAVESHIQAQQQVYRHHHITPHLFSFTFDDE
jgi:hypothetical protein